jgi:hypothetical protein
VRLAAREKIRSAAQRKYVADYDGRSVFIWLNYGMPQRDDDWLWQQPFRLPPQEGIMFTVIQRYSFDPRLSAALNHNIKEAFVPLLRQAPGFVAYYWLDTGDGSGASLCVFEDQASADAALDLAAGIIFEHLAALAGMPDVIRGEVKVYANCGI